jgi:hypothetical protein
MILLFFSLSSEGIEGTSIHLSASPIGEGEEGIESRFRTSGRLRYLRESMPLKSNRCHSTLARGLSKGGC